MFHYVYITTNLINGQQYVGDRSCNCLPEKDKYLGSGRPLFDNAKRKYGKENFEKQILEVFQTRKEAFDAQAKYILQFNTLSPNGYNLSPTGGAQINGWIKHSEETKRKMSIKAQKRIGEKNSMFGKHHSKETIKKLQQPKSQETKDKISKTKKEQNIKTWFGKHHTEETKTKLRKPKSQETKDKISKATKGRIPWNKFL